jgi:lipopolysaccharide export system ATP-binding protein
MEKKLLSIKNLSKYYKKRPVVRDASLEIRNGEIVGLLGPNGAGKTTLFTMIAGLIHPNAGNILIDNEDITEMPIHVRAKLGLGYLPQESSIFRGLNVEDNIMLVLEIAHDCADEREKILEELMAEFSISHLRYTQSTALSGGERRRLEIARTIALKPSFILLDEPLAGVDPIAVKDIKALIKKLQEKNIGILITDHNARETLDMVDRAYIMYDGKILMEGSPQEIVNSDNVKSLYLGDEFKIK